MSVWHWLIVLLAIALYCLPIYFYIKTYQSVALQVNSVGGDAPITSAWLLYIPP